MTKLATIIKLLSLVVTGVKTTNLTDHGSVYCRTERNHGSYLTLQDYHDDTCARCYHYLPKWSFLNESTAFRYLGPIGQLQDPVTKSIFYPRPTNHSSPIFSTFKASLYSDLWISCCKAAMKCCHTMLSSSGLYKNESHCPRTWDGWQCWPDTPASQMAYAHCPDHIYFKNEPPQCSRYAKKMCDPNGAWLVTDQSKEWTDYSSCGISLRKRLLFHIITFAVSISALIPSLVVFYTYKQLQVPRVTVHKNLFFSLLINGVFVIIFRAIILIEESDELKDGQNFFQQNGPECKLLFVATKYFRMTSYMWMFCEGLYIDRLISAAFTEWKSLTLLYAIGWGFPIVPVGIYAAIRKSLKDERCWVIPIGPYEWIMHGPYLLSLLLNLGFLCKILRNLVTKIKATHPHEPSQYRKAVRAILILVPLFGVHFFFDKYRPAPGECGWMNIYIYFNFAIDGFQGFIVALIFCYLNGEVLSLLKRSYQKYKLRHSVQVGFSRSLKVARMSTSSQVYSLNESECIKIKYPMRHFYKGRRNLFKAEVAPKVEGLYSEQV
ncbi:calcitonin gene-related peptide type 1 receptor-like isoform X2 [Tachypleus tridentatus]|uniref:calcitonin gene-related peptide type 1 receptor-like isoform X2 n=1 Tax=Tachypleus tridentatus TaxID=6853 RepID=UPI003FD5198F